MTISNELPPPVLDRLFPGDRTRTAMELTAIEPGQRFTFDKNCSAQIALRHRLIGDRRSEVVAVLPMADAASHEILETVAEACGFDRMAEDRTGAEALARAGGLIAEDLLILADEPQGPRLIGAVLCFPTRWHLSEKLGRPLVDVHAPVPGYAAHLSNPVNRVIARLLPGRAVERFTWSLGDDASLFQPAARGVRRVITADNAGQALVLRIERQTLSRLPRSGAVLFTIRVDVAPLGRRASTPHVAAQIAATVRALPDALADYKGLTAFRAPLLAWLDQRATA